MCIHFSKTPLWLLTLLVVVSVLTHCGKSGEQNDSASKQESKGRKLDYTHSLSFLDNSRSDTLGIIQIAVAETEQERNDGLMDVNSLPDDKGMLFVFDNQEPRSFWMANTPLSLDIIFVNNKGKIVRIHQQTKPFSDQKYISRDPARYVVEVKGGYCINHDIKEGDFVSLPDESKVSE